MKGQCRFAAIGLLAGGVCAGLAQANLPTNDEQYWLELVNRMRMHPAAELHKLVNINPGWPATWGNPISEDVDVARAIEQFEVDPHLLSTQWASLQPAQPLAWNSKLHNAAVGHNAQVIAFNEQSHQLPGEPSFTDRISNAGYDWYIAGENVYAYSYNVFYGHAGFAIDWGYGPGGIQDPAGHRDNIMEREFKEVGIAITPSQVVNHDDVGPLVVTQDFAARTGNPFITGVIYADTVKRDQFYTPGEGLSGISIEVRRASNDTLVQAAVSYGSGGYAVAVPNGTYNITFSGGTLGAGMTYRNVAVNGENIKLDSLSSWMGASNAAWSNMRNWHGGVPNGAGTVATIGPASSTGSGILVDQAATVGTISIESEHPYTINGSSTLTLQTLSGPAKINLPLGGNHRILAPLMLSSNTEINVGSEGVLSFQGNFSIAAGKTLTRKGSGTVEIAGVQSHGAGSELVALSGRTNFASGSGSRQSRQLGVTIGSDAIVDFQADQHLRRLSIIGGRAVVDAGGDKVLFTDALSIDATGQLDLNDNILIVQATAATRTAVLAEVTGWVISARGSGNSLWQGSGITSSVAAGNQLTGLTIALNDKGNGKDPLFTEFDGEEVDINSILVKYTWNGDVTLDGRVDASDYFLVDKGFLNKASGQRNGDLNFDGRVDASDYFLIDKAFLGQTGILSGLKALQMAAVPEPGVAAVVVFGLLSGLLRRRRATH